MSTLKNIFLIEDCENDRYFFTEAINKIENVCICDTARNGQEAIDKLLNALLVPDLIFSDINMPKMDGIMCLSEIKKIPRLQHVPVVFLSSDTRRVDTVKKLGANGFIKKPDDTALLKEQIEKLVTLCFITDANIASATFITLI